MGARAMDLKTTAKQLEALLELLAPYVVEAEEASAKAGEIADGEDEPTVAIGVADVHWLRNEMASALRAIKSARRKGAK